MAEKHKQKNTFIVQIEERENASWQGSVIWADARRKKYFRSALVLDEPTSNLDESGIGALVASVGRLKDQGIAILICDHRGWM